MRDLLPAGVGDLRRSEEYEPQQDEQDTENPAPDSLRPRHALHPNRTLPFLRDFCRVGRRGAVRWTKRTRP